VVENGDDLRALTDVHKHASEMAATRISAPIQWNDSAPLPRSPRTRTSRSTLGEEHPEALKALRTYLRGALRRGNPEWSARIVDQALRRWVKLMARSGARLEALLREATALLRLASAAREYRSAVRALDEAPLGGRAADLDAAVGDTMAAIEAEIRRRGAETAYELAIETRMKPGRRPPAAQEAIHWANGWRCQATGKMTPERQQN
jgi:hypothetical protein